MSDPARLLAEKLALKAMKEFKEHDGSETYFDTALAAELIRDAFDERERIIHSLLSIGQCTCKKTWAGTLTEECRPCWAARQLERLTSRTPLQNAIREVSKCEACNGTGQKKVSTHG